MTFHIINSKDMTLIISQNAFVITRLLVVLVTINVLIIELVFAFGWDKIANTTYFQNKLTESNESIEKRKLKLNTYLVASAICLSIVGGFMYYTWKNAMLTKQTTIEISRTTFIDDDDDLFDNDEHLDTSHLETDDEEADNNLP